MWLFEPPYDVPVLALVICGCGLIFLEKAFRTQQSPVPRELFQSPLAMLLLSGDSKRRAMVKHGTHRGSSMQIMMQKDPDPLSPWDEPPLTRTRWS